MENACAGMYLSVDLKVLDLHLIKGDFTSMLESVRMNMSVILAS